MSGGLLLGLVAPVVRRTGATRLWNVGRIYGAAAIHTSPIPTNQVSTPGILILMVLLERVGVRQLSFLQKEVLISDGMTVVDLAERLDWKVEKMLSRLGACGIKPGNSKVSTLSLLECENLVTSAGHTPKFERILSPIERPPEVLMPRPPVVAVMGHVDHGKTTLLDSLRQTAVAASEAGGITQHIGAFSVKLASGAQLTFLDTPGHAAFSNMRARGARATDMVVLVVAADDGVKEQTRESIKMIKKANVPMVVAINKCDKYKIDIGRVKMELLECGVQLEEYGGEVQGVEVSALQRKGLDSLEEALLVLAEVSQVKGDPTGPVQGVIIETKVDRALGTMASLVVQHGTLRAGDVLVAGEAWCKVRALQNERGERMKEAPPSSPVLTTGWRTVPLAGEICLQAASEQEAKNSIKELAILLKAKGPGATPTLADADDIITVPLVVKGDVMGSVEALVKILSTRQPQGFRLKVVQSGVGPVTEGDMDMAASTKGIVLAFGVSCPQSIQSVDKYSEVKILSHKVIYKLLDMLKDELESQLEPVMKEEELGVASVTQVFKLTGAKKATIGGCVVQEGKLMRSATFRVIRNDNVVHEGPLSGMRTEKSDVSSAGEGVEVGLKFSKDIGIEVGDRVVCYRTSQVEQSVHWDMGF